MLKGSFSTREACEADLGRRHAIWLAAQEAARKADEEEEDEYWGQPATVATELAPRGFAAAYASLLKEFAPGDAVPDQKALMGLFRIFDADCNGTISLADLIAIVIENARSGWLGEKPRSSRFKSLGMLLGKTTSMRSGSSHGNLEKQGSKSKALTISKSKGSIQAIES